MAKGKQSSKGKKEQYSAYKTQDRYSKNRIRRMRRHLKNHPNDEQTAKQLAKGPSYRRGRPGSNPGANKKELEDNRQKTIGKRKVYDSKGFLVKHRTGVSYTIKSVRERFNDLGIYRGRDFRNKAVR